MKLRGLSLLLLLTAATGCLHTQIQLSGYGKIEGIPYQKMLVCALPTDPKLAAEMEDIMSADLRKRHVVTETCHQWVAPHLNGGLPPTLHTLQQQTFDGVLVMQRESVSKASAPVNGIDAPFKNVQGFLEAYAARRTLTEEQKRQIVQASEINLTSRWDPDRIVYGRVDLIGCRENQVIWGIAGRVVGSNTDPTSKFMQSFASSVQSGLSSAGVLK